MSDARQTVVRGDNLIGLGYLPDFTPLSHVDRLTGIIAGIGGVALASPMTFQIRRSDGSRCSVFELDIAEFPVNG